MKDPPAKVPVASETCSLCGHGVSGSPSEVEIAIRKGHVRRASLAADGVYGLAQSSEGVEPGVVLMSAILLIERLASAHQCDPRAVITKIARCFDIRDGYLRAAKEQN